MSESACACLQVKYSPIRNDNGSLTEDWQCELCHTRYTKLFWWEKSKERIADLERKLAEAWEEVKRLKQILEDSDNYKSFCELKVQLTEAREVIKPFADTYAEAMESKDHLGRPKISWDSFCFEEETVQRAAQWYKDNQPEK